jgi:hypothetical protein
MRVNTYRYEEDDSQPPAVTYWKRRFIALVVGLAILGTVSWAFSGALGGSGGTVADVGHTRGASPSASAGATPGAQPSTAPSPGPPGAANSGSQNAAAADAAPQSAGVPACRPGSIVLSVFASQASYGPGNPPEFNLAVVSTAGATCAFNVGPRFLALVVAGGGKRVWGSADCAVAPGSLVTDLARGIPSILPVSWDLQTSAPGCRAAAGQAGDGTYTATASDDGDTSSPATFSLG